MTEINLWSKMRYWASRAFVYANAQNGLPALPPEVRFCLLGQRPKPFEQPLAGAGCAFGNRTLFHLIQSSNLYFSFTACAIISGLFDGENPNSAAKKSYAKVDTKE